MNHEEKENHPYGAVNVPVVHSSTFRQEKLEEIGDYFYSRIDNPTRHTLEEQLAALEEAEYALAFSSGMAAISTTLFALLDAGDSIATCDDLYGGTQNLLKKMAAKKIVGVQYADATDHQKFIVQTITRKTRLIFLESPTNPLLKLCDIQAISECVHDMPDKIVLVDNTFATPAGQRPLELGADISLHSITKYINGHSNVIGGCIMTNNKKLWQAIHEARTMLGTGLDPDSSARVMNNIATFDLRMEEHQRIAQCVVRTLKNHPAVEWFRYPGSSDHPQFELARRQMRNYSGMVTFKLKGNFKNTEAFFEHLDQRVIIHAVSLGGVESLIEVPALFTHQGMSDEEKAASKLSDTIIRLSVGIREGEQALQEALNTALDASLRILIRDSVGTKPRQDKQLSETLRGHHDSL